MVKPWPLVSSETVADTGFFSVTRDRARSPRTGGEKDFFIIHMADWVQVVPLTTDGRLVMIRQYRHGSRKTGLEVPGGLMEPGDAGPRECAARELAEETGYGGGVYLSLGDFWPQPALLANRVSFVAARGVAPAAGRALDDGEDIEVVLVGKDEVDRKISSGEVHNAMTVTALTLARAKGLL